MHYRESPFRLRLDSADAVTTAASVSKNGPASSSAVGPNDLPSEAGLLKLFGPLVISGIFFPLSRPIINAFLARAEDPEIALATMSVTVSLTYPVIAPLFAVRQLGNTLCVDREMYRRLLRITFSLGGVAMVLLGILSWRPIFHWFVGGVLGVPGALLESGPPVLFVMALATSISGARAFYQGMLVRYGRSGPVGLAAVCFIAAVSSLMALGIAFLDWEGAFIAAWAVLVGQATYLIILWLPGREISRQMMTERDPSLPQGQRTTRAVFRVFYPLAGAGIVYGSLEPVVQMSMARAPEASMSLAAYPVALSLTWLVRSPIYNAQQVVIANVRDRASYLVVRRFMMKLGIAATLLMGVIAFTPLSGFIFSSVMGLTGTVREYATDGFRLLALAPFFQAIRSFYGGALIAKRTTGYIQIGALVRLGGLFLGLYVGVTMLEIAGVFIAIGATILAEIGECIFLGWVAQRKFGERPAL